MDSVIDGLLRHLAGGGAGVAWVLVVYLLLRIHQLVDRQHAVNVQTAELLAVLKLLLTTRITGGDK